MCLWVLSKASLSKYSYSDFMVNDLKLLQQTDEKSNAVKRQGFRGLEKALPDSTCNNFVMSINSRICSISVCLYKRGSVFSNNSSDRLEFESLSQTWRKKKHQSCPDLCTFFILCTRTGAFSFSELTDWIIIKYKIIQSQFLSPHHILEINSMVFGAAFGFLNSPWSALVCLQYY